MSSRGLMLCIADGLMDRTIQAAQQTGAQLPAARAPGCHDRRPPGESTRTRAAGGSEPWQAPKRLPVSCSALVGGKPARHLENVDWLTCHDGRTYAAAFVLETQALIETNGPSVGGKDLQLQACDPVLGSP